MGKTHVWSEVSAGARRLKAFFPKCFNVCHLCFPIPKSVFQHLKLNSPSQVYFACNSSWWVISLSLLSPTSFHVLCARWAASWDLPSTSPEPYSPGGHNWPQGLRVHERYAALSPLSSYLSMLVGLAYCSESFCHFSQDIVTFLARKDDGATWWRAAGCR